MDVIDICLLADISTESVFALSTNLPLFNTIWFSKYSGAVIGASLKASYNSLSNSKGIF